jgi:hypothetical protein
MDQVVSETAEDKELHVILDNYCTSLIWTPPGLQAMFDVGVKIWLQPYIRPVVQTGSACWP